MSRSTTTKAAKALGSLGGSKRSPKKKKAAIANLKKAVAAKAKKQSQSNGQVS